mmetsp:Transcript_73378/g.162296  ORF Transcript_73378/g.162296 Transcript_73378/m.162296 type:complete len:335 (+) Transcript_73378:126-1130(+)
MAMYIQDVSLCAIAHGNADLPIKNTFIHYDVDAHSSCGLGRERALRRCRTDPWDLLSVRSQSPTMSSSTKAGDASPCRSSLGATSDTLPSPSPSVSSFGLSPVSLPLMHDDGMQTPEPESPLTESIDTTPESWATPTEWTQAWPPEATLPCLPKVLAVASAPQLHPASFPPSPESPVVDIEGLGTIFSFTLRLANGVGLGLNVTRSHDDYALIVKGVLPEGGIQSWNRQVLGSSKCMKAVELGDAIVSANGTTGCQGMLDALMGTHLVKLSILRQSPDLRQTMACMSQSTMASEYLQWGCFSPIDDDTCNNFHQDPFLDSQVFVERFPAVVSRV